MSVGGEMTGMEPKRYHMVAKLWAVIIEPVDIRDLLCDLGELNELIAYLDVDNMEKLEKYLTDEQLFDWRLASSHPFRGLLTIDGEDFETSFDNLSDDHMNAGVIMAQRRYVIERMLPRVRAKLAKKVNEILIEPRAEEMDLGRLERLVEALRDDMAVEEFARWESWKKKSK